MSASPLAGHVGIIGAGIIGLATAKTLLDRYPGLRLTVLEKEPAVGLHQSARNSGVVHTGIYYAPGSLKARLCTRGRGLLRDYCLEKGLPYREVGKLLVALDPVEERRLRAIHERGVANRVPGLRVIPPEGIRFIEPCAVGRLGLHVPTAAITDFGAVTRALGDDVMRGGGRIVTGSRVIAMEPASAGVRAITTEENYDFTSLIACAGLYSDVVAGFAGDTPDPRIVPFRGDFLPLRRSAHELVRGLIYPVPDPRFPFLGVHLTRTVDGRVLIGPSAILAFAREGYSLKTFDRRELWDTVRWRGFRRLARKHWRTGATELYRALRRKAFIQQARRYTPDLGFDDVERTVGSGVRAQAVDRDGVLVDDFRLSTRGPVVNIRNAPSPAATSSLAIAEMIVDGVERTRS